MATKTATTEKRTWVHEALEWIDSIVMSVIVVVLLFTFVFKIVGIVGESMTNTLMNGDRVLVCGLGYEPKVGDVVIISRNASNIIEDEDTEDERIIKRVIALEGQTVTIDQTGIVKVDGTEIQESYVKEHAKTFPKEGNGEYSHIVADGCVFVLGDNREGSLDSRSSVIGDVDKRYILGKAICRVVPFSEFKWL